MNMPAVTQYVLYNNDAVDVFYSDGSHLMLAPCGSSFSYQRALQPGCHPTQQCPSIQQRCQFVTSEFQPCVVDALDFRNRFAIHPFICKDLTGAQKIVKLHADITEIAWPKTLNDQLIRKLADGSTHLVSQDEYATLTLGSHRKHFTIEYLAKVSQKPTRKLGSRTTQSKSSASDQSSNLADVCHHTKDSESRWDYVWNIQYHSVQNCPEHWQIPLQLLLNYLQEHDTHTVHFDLPEGHSDTSLDFCNLSTSTEASSPESANTTGQVNSPLTDSKLSIRRLLRKDFRGCIFSSVPETLPLSCNAQHLHKLGTKHYHGHGDVAEAAYIQGQVKVICIQGVIYRLLWKNPVGVEIYPGDGSIMLSAGLAGKFFTHYLLRNGQIVERMYSVESPPPASPCSAYSVGKLIIRGARFLQHICDDSLQLVVQEERACWKRHEVTDRTAEPSNRLLEECVVGGVGKFTAFTNGHIRVVFTDRTCLDMAFVNDAKFTPQSKRKSSQPRILDLPDGVCRLLLPSGQYQYVYIDQAGIYDKYVKAAKEWEYWVTAKPAQRSDFYKDTIFDPEKNRTIHQELKKIQCFNFILENSLLAKFSPVMAANQMRRNQVTSIGNLSADKMTLVHHIPDHFDMTMIQQILQKTSAAVKDIDNLLGMNGETKPIQD